MVLQVSLHLGAVSSEPDIVVILLVTSGVVLDAALFFVGTLLDDLEDGFTTEEDAWRIYIDTSLQFTSSCRLVYISAEAPQQSPAHSVCPPQSRTCLSGLWCTWSR